MSSQINSKYQTKKNILFNLLTFIANAILGVWLPPFLIQRLGVDVYGLIPISMSITSFMLLVTISINGTLSRFLSIDFEKKDQSSSITFSTAFFLVGGLTIILLPLSILFSIYADRFLSIPASVVTDAKWMLALVFISFFVNAVAALFNSIAYVKNRIDLSNTSVIINRVLILVVLILIFAASFINIQAYGIAVLIATVAGLIYSLYVFKKLTPEIVLSHKLFDYNQLKRIGNLGLWLIISQVGVILFLQTDILVLNYFKGAKMSGIYATLLQWSFLIRALVGILSGAIGPLVLSLSAKKEFERLTQLTVFSTKILGIFTTIICSVLIYFSQDILYIWLGSEFVEYKWVFILIICHLGINLSINSIVNINIAFNKARVPGIVALVTGFINILLGIALLLYTDLGLYGIAIAGLTALTLKNFIFTPYYTAKIMNIATSSYYKPIMPSLLLSVAVVIITALFPSDLLHIGKSYFLLATYIIIFSIVISAFVYFVLLNAKDKKTLIALIKSKTDKA